MSRIFLSHSSKDDREAVALKQWLVEQDPPLATEIFLDLDRRSGIRPGAKWKEQLQQASVRCEVVICLLSSSWETSIECNTEFRTAENLHKRIFCARLEPSTRTSITREWQWVNLFGEGPKTEIEVDINGQRELVVFSTEGLLRLKDEIVEAGVGAESFEWPPPNELDRAPYRGWEPLEEVDAGVFFGRDAELVRGLDALRGMRTSGVESLFVVLGASGAGKSSFLRAGLLPRLRRDYRTFVVLDIVRPERNVLTGVSGLARAIYSTRSKLGLKEPQLAEIKEACLGNTKRVRALLRDIQEAAASAVLVDVSGGQPLPTLVLPVDQAEELFGPDAGPEAPRFLDMLDQHARTSAARRLSLVVALTIRTDRYEALQTAPQLAAVKGVVFDDVKPMPQGQFKEVIVGPARRATEGGRPLQLEPALVEKLLAECTEGADTLPLLSLTLARLFQDYGSDGNLTLAEYESMGGMCNVVQTEVDGLLSRDDTTRRAQLGQLRSAFIPWLATISPDTDQPLRRVARWDDLPAEARPLLDGFVGKRLLIKDKRKSGDVIEVALESLLRNWDELRRWLEEERENLKKAAELERSAAEWRKNGCKREWLLEGDQILDARKLFQKPGFQDLLSSAREFVEESGRVEDDLKRRARRGAIVLRTFIAAAVVTALVAGFTLLKWMVSEGQNQARMREATAWRLVSESEQMLEGARAGGDVRALQQLLAANRLGATSAEAVVNTRRDQLRILENPLRPDGVTPVRSVAVSPDGHRIASGSDDHKVRLWDTDTGRQLAELVVASDPPKPDQQRPVWGVAFSPDGKWIATGSGARYLQVWDANSGKKIGDPITHSEAVHSVAFSPDSRLIATGSDDGAVRVWDWATGREAVKFAGHDQGTTVRSVAFSPGGDLIASGGDDGTVRLWDTHTGRLVARVGDGSTAMCVAFSRDGGRVVVGLDNGTVEIMDGRNGWTVGDSFNAHPNAVTSVVFSPDGTRIVSGGADNSVRVWNSVDHTPIGRPLLGHHGEVSSIVLNSQGTMIVSGSLDGSVREWDVGGLPIPAGQGAIRTVAFRPDGRQIASAGRDGTVKLWDPVTATPIIQLGESSAGYEHAINALAFSPDGSRIVTGTTDGSVRLWEVKTRQARMLPMVDPAGQPSSTRARITSVAFSPDGTRIVSGGNDGVVRVWDAHSLTSTGVMTAKIVDERGKPMPYPVWSVAFSPDGRQIASGSGGYDNSIQLWDVASRAADGPPMVGHPGWNIYSVGFSGDGQRIVSGSNDGTIRVWNVKTRQQVAKMSGDENSVLSVAFAHNHPWIVSGHADGAVRVWDANTFQPIGAPQAGHQDWVHTVAFSADDARILSGSADGDLQLWSAPRDIAEVVCSKLSVNMSHKQWNDWVSPKIDYIQMCPGLDVPPDER